MFHHVLSPAIHMIVPRAEPSAHRPIGLDVFPLHSEAWIHAGWTAAFTAFPLVTAAPLPRLSGEKLQIEWLSVESESNVS